MKFSSPPGPALPVSVANGGTGAATLGDAGVLIGNGTGAVQVTGAGTSGQVLTSNGAGVDPTFQAAAGGGTPTMKLTSDFSTSGRYVTNNVGSGANTAGTYGVTIETGATGTSESRIRWQPVKTGGGFSAFAGSPIFSCEVDAYGVDSANGTGSSYFGIGAPSSDGSGHTYTVAHIGFKILKTGAVVSLYATQADGTTENASAALTTFTADNTNFDLILKVNSTTSVDYYWRKEGGSLSSATNLTTNLPTTSTTIIGQWSTSNNATAFTFNFGIGGFCYER